MPNINLYKFHDENISKNIIFLCIMYYQAVIVLWMQQNLSIICCITLEHMGPSRHSPHYSSGNTTKIQGHRSLNRLHGIPCYLFKGRISLEAFPLLWYALNFYHHLYKIENVKMHQNYYVINHSLLSDKIF